MKLLPVLVVCAWLPAGLAAQDLAGVKCIVDPANDARAEMNIDYRGGQIFFCCRTCIGKFQENPDPWLIRAHYQLVATGQFVQTACPLTGQGVADDISVKVGHVSVGLCCDDCRVTLQKADEIPDQLAMAFGLKSFSRGFRLKPAATELNLAGVKCLMKPAEDVSADYAIEFNGGSLFLCCQQCRNEFDRTVPEQVCAANRQLVRTGQFAQTACPFSGRPVLDGATTKIGDLEIGFCNLGCRDKVRDAADDGARTGMVFGEQAFANGFARTQK